MEDFRRKARLVAVGHMTETPKCMTYSSVVGRETVHIALTIAALNDLHVKAGDVMNAYVTAPCSEKIWTVLFLFLSFLLVRPPIFGGLHRVALFEIRELSPRSGTIIPSNTNLPNFC